MMTDERQSTELATVEPPFSSALASQQSRAVFLPANLAQAMQLAEYMASGIGVRQWMRGNPSACLALIQISMRWGMDPYIVSNKAYYANDTLSFESQLVNAVINTSGALIGRLKVEFVGDVEGGKYKETLNCKVSGRLVADPDQLFVHEQALWSVKIRNSPLWEVNPKQQLQYHATRAWARLYMPEVLLGIYTPDEIADGEAMRLQAASEQRSPDVKAPDRRDFERVAAVADAQDAEFAEIETVLPKDEPEEEGEAVVETADSIQGDGSGTALPDAQPLGEQTMREAGPETTPPAEVEPAHILDLVPTTPAEWAVWQTEAKKATEDVRTRAEFDTLRRRLTPTMEVADQGLLESVQEWLTDALTALPEDKK